MENELNDIVYSVLRTVFKHDSFKSDLQEQAVKAIIKGKPLVDFGLTFM